MARLVVLLVVMVLVACAASRGGAAATSMDEPRGRPKTSTALRVLIPCDPCFRKNEQCRTSAVSAFLAQRAGVDGGTPLSDLGYREIEKVISAVQRVPSRLADERELASAVDLCSAVERKCLRTCEDTPSLRSAQR